MTKRPKYKYVKNPGKLIWVRTFGAGDLLVCSLTSYYGPRISLRVWRMNDEGEYYPTRNGLNVRPDELELVSEAIEAAMEHGHD